MTGRKTPNDVMRIADERIQAMWNDLGDPFNPETELAFAETLLDHAISHASSAYVNASEDSVDLGSNDRDPEPIKIVRRRMTSPGRSPIEAAVYVVRQRLGLPSPARTADLEGVLEQLDERVPIHKDIREAINHAVKGIRATADAVEKLHKFSPDVGSVRTMALLLSSAANVGKWILARTEGNYTFGHRAPHTWLQAIDSVQSVNSSIGDKKALRMILDTTDRDEHSAKWETLVERIYEQVKQARRRRRKSQR